MWTCTCPRGCRTSSTSGMCSSRRATPSWPRSATSPGLGWNPTTGAPILPEHDMELAFDVQFSVEDVVEINILRAAINKLVCDGPNGARHLGPERVAQLQDSVRQKLLGLFCQLKPRARTVPKWPDKPYEWNQVDPKLVMEQAEREGGCGKSTFLYQLHRLIVLSS
uniref:Tudor domain containing 9 n=1 Tax=Myotis myotis TaxID=51298 RepID=A0A7J7R1M7_MYOMY|nr:tudor domain containing 9 [Myotis myotis]